MRLVFLLPIILLLAGCSRQVAPGGALPGDKMEKIAKLLELSNTKTNFLAGIDQQIGAMKNSPIAAQLPEGFFELFGEKARTEGYGVIQASLISYYNENFSEGEVDYLLRQAMDPMAQAMQKRQAALQLHLQEAGRIWGEQVGLEIVTELMNKQ